MCVAVVCRKNCESIESVVQTCCVVTGTWKPELPFSGSRNRKSVVVLFVFCYVGYAPLVTCNSVSVSSFGGAPQGVCPPIALSGKKLLF